jgi:hypothetical protein
LHYAAEKALRLALIPLSIIIMLIGLELAIRVFVPD